MIHLLHPTALLIPLIYLILLKFTPLKQKSIYISNYELFLKVVSKGIDWRGYLRFAIIVLLSLVLATPVIDKTNHQNSTKKHDIAIILDASNSMLEDDRFVQSKKVISNFIKNRKDDRVSLSLFADDTYIASPMTSDTKTLLGMLDHIEIGVAGQRQTSLYEAIYLSSKLFDKNSNEKVAILLTDGLNTVDTLPLSKAISLAKSRGVKIYTIGIGEDYSKETLELIASSLDGAFYQVKDSKDLGKIYTKIDKLEKNSLTLDSHSQYSYLYFYPLAFALVLLVILLVVELYFSSFSILLLISTFLLAYALYVSPMPLQKEQPKRPKQETKTITLLLDISKSMSVNDIYPSRFDAMKHKLGSLVDRLGDEQISVIAFSKVPYLVTPATNNKEGIKNMISMLDATSVQTNGTNILSALQALNALDTQNSTKVALLATDGGDKDNYSLEASYAKEHNISIIVYAIATNQGAIIKDRGEIVLDSNGNIAISTLNHNIKTLAYDGEISDTTYTLGDRDIDNIADKITALSGDSHIGKNIISKESLRLIYIITVLVILLLFAQRFSKKSL